MRRPVTIRPKESTIVIGIEKVLVLLQVLELYLVSLPRSSIST
ncbi:MAG: hypothetical protein A4E46_00910 [Methanosaeta sp. PtaU1.Bin016]|nr:MAG: hypothetical protein A4E46_00910 [Methanosaeta sp. PtaU1.Bin016]